MCCAIAATQRPCPRWHGEYAGGKRCRHECDYSKKMPHPVQWRNGARHSGRSQDRDAAGLEHRIEDGDSMNEELKPCPACGKEGHIHAHAEMDEFLRPGYRDVVLMDNNILAQII